MFSKLTMGLALAMSLTLTSNAFAQTKKADTKKAAQTKAATEAKAAEEAKATAEKKAAEEKALEAKRAEEAKAAAAKTSIADNSGVLGYIKSHFSAGYHGEFYGVRRNNVYQERQRANNPAYRPDENDNDIQDYKFLHNPSITYRPVQNLKLLVTSEFKYTDAPGYVEGGSRTDADGDGEVDGSQSLTGSYVGRHFRTLVLLTRENVLTEAEHGVKMDLTIGRRIFDRLHGNAGSYGNSRVNASLSKKFSDKLSTSLLAQYLANDPVYRRIGASTWKHSIELIPSFTFQITDKLSYFFNDDLIINTPFKPDTQEKFDISHEMNIGVLSYQINDSNSTYFQLKYLHFAGTPFATASNVDDYVEYYIGYAYSVTPKFTITPEIGGQVLTSGDGKSFLSDKIKYPELALYLDISI